MRFFNFFNHHNLHIAKKAPAEKKKNIEMNLKTKLCDSILFLIDQNLLIAPTPRGTCRIREKPQICFEFVFKFMSDAQKVNLAEISLHERSCFVKILKL